MDPQTCLKTEPFDKYQKVAERLQDPHTIRLLHGMMGVDTEAGELTDQLKKHIFYGKELDIVNLKEEVGDLLWYLAILCHALNCFFEELMELNINKLRARYGDKFTEAAALNRNLEKERKVLDVA